MQSAVISGTFFQFASTKQLNEDLIQQPRKLRCETLWDESKEWGMVRVSYLENRIRLSRFHW